MFYVADGKVYSTVRDESAGGYPEYAVRVDAEGTKTLAKTGGVSSAKPAHRQVCTIEEVFAQFAGTPEPAPSPEAPKRPAAAQQPQRPAASKNVKKS